MRRNSKNAEKKALPNGGECDTIHTILSDEMEQKIVQALLRGARVELYIRQDTGELVAKQVFRKPCL